MWEQPLDGGPVRRLSDVSSGGIGLAFSPDGSRIAFFAFVPPAQELRVFDFSTGETRTLGTGISPVDPSWTPDGDGLIAWEDLNRDRGRLILIRLDDGTRATLAEVERLPSCGSSYTTVSSDARWLYFLQEDGRPVPKSSP